MPFSSLDARRIRSAGKYSFFTIFTMSPTLISFHNVDINYSLIYTKHLLLFSALSDCLLLLSSMASFTAETMSTNNKGNKMFGIPPETEISGIHYKTATQMKYTLDNLWNCSHKFLGRNVKALYLAVSILFPMNDYS